MGSGEEGPKVKRRKKEVELEKNEPFRQLIETLENSPKKYLLELGCGCGVSGLSIAKLYPSWTVHLTDLPEATSLVEKNITANTLKNTTFSVLDWEAPFPSDLKAPSIVLISDCTYNPDTAEPLVKTLERIAEKREDVLIFLAYKKRHEDERLFFELVERRFETVGQAEQSLVANDGFEHEELVWITYGLRKEGGKST